MKKLLSLSLALILVFSLFACGRDNEEAEIVDDNKEVITDENISTETPAEPEASEKEDVEQEAPQKPEDKPVSGTPEAKPEVKPEAKPEVEEQKPQTPSAEEKPSAGEAKTTGDIMLGIFRANKDKSIEDIANACLADPSIQFMSGTMPVEKGFLAEFGGDITNFDKGIKFGPMMGSIAFSGFVFEVSGDANAFAKELAEKADPRWNICVEADQTVYEVSGNKVFFLMCPKSLEG